MGVSMQMGIWGSAWPAVTCAQVGQHSKAGGRQWAVGACWHLKQVHARAANSRRAALSWQAAARAEQAAQPSRRVLAGRQQQVQCMDNHAV